MPPRPVKLSSPALLKAPERGNVLEQCGLAFARIRLSGVTSCEMGFWDESLASQRSTIHRAASVPQTGAGSFLRTGDLSV
ncbi:unnamed protein product [Protopolystoma xenopodis]|uniref:Uncharacterized protein n=1 Tax=Protopolystoma xenopodis TaxID=117903 RepID=A0A3S5A093_9PLAT|nr:unnamed protein product [Protopolystoma xenopodis]